MEVEFGQVWRVGSHHVACGDLELGHAAKLLSMCGYAHMAYVDPPWNQGMAANFRRRAGYEDTPDFAALMRHLFAALALTDGAVYVEIGHQNRGFMETWGAYAGFVHRKFWEVRYGKDTSWLYQFSKERVYDDAGPRDSCDWYLPAWAIKRSSKHGEVVFDPCVGLGTTATACIKTGRVLLGMDLGAEQVQHTLEMLINTLNMDAHLVGRFR